MRSAVTLLSVAAVVLVQVLVVNRLPFGALSDGGPGPGRAAGAPGAPPRPPRAAPRTTAAAAPS
jgi:hypothetical protein